MHFSQPSFLLAAVAAPLANAFPAAMFEAAANDPEIFARAEKLHKRQQGAGDAQAIFEPVPTFSPSQYINVTKGSGHEYVPPGDGDLRGPCPGLNAFANHNFLPHDGYATVQQFIDATTKVVGMGPQLSLFLSVYGGVIDGDIGSWSIAGTPTLAQGGVTGKLANGLVGSHNKYESDGSPTRPDLYQAGNNYMTITSQFQEMIDASPGGELTMDSLTAFRSARNDKQISTNGYFFYGPFTGVLVQPAAYTFIYRFMANHSAEFPVGKLTYETVQSWFGVQGTNRNYQAIQGTERIPDNWYRRAFEYPYEVTYFLGDVLNAAKLHPKFLSVGGNTGQPNTFTGVDIPNLTQGLYNGATLTEGNNFACFVYQLAQQAKPDILGGLLDTLTNAIGQLSSKLSCPQLKAIDTAQLEMFPGYTRQPVYG